MLLVLLGLAFVRAGFWQEHRAYEAHSVLAGFAAATTAAPLQALPRTASKSVRYKSVQLTGHYVPKRQFLINGMVRNGRTGYDVLTPFAPAHGGRWIIVNRGWVPASPYRSVLPDVPVSGSERTIMGRFADLPAPGLRVGKPARVNEDDPLSVLFYPTMQQLEHRLGKSLFPYQVELENTQPDGFKRGWKPPVVMSPARHWGYAAQWWGFAVIAFGAAGALTLRALGWRKS